MEKLGSVDTSIFRRRPKTEELAIEGEPSLSGFQAEATPLQNDTYGHKTFGSLSVDIFRQAHPSYRFRAVFYYSVHFPALAITLGILSLVWHGVFWEAPSPNTNAKLNALQFAAKIHEGFMFLSLSAIVFHQVQRHLQSKNNGIPLGLLNSTYQISSASYMFSHEFWHGLWILRYSRRHVCSAIVLVLALALAPAIGPASAIIMIPKLGWWDLPPSYSWQAFLRTDELQIFPRNVTTPYKSGGFDDISNFLQDSAFLDLGRWMSPMNLTVPSPFIGLQRRILGAPLSGGVPYTSTSTSLLAAQGLQIFRSLYGFDDDDDAGSFYSRLRIFVGSDPGQNWQSVEFFDPLVEVECSLVNTNDTIATLPMPHELLLTEPWDEVVYQNASWSLPPAVFLALKSNKTWNGIGPREGFADSQTNNVSFRWFNTSHIEQAEKPSLGAAWFSATHNQSFQPFGILHICTVDARWVPAKAWTDENDMMVYEQSVDFPSNDAYDIPFRPIHISDNWASTIDQTYKNQTYLEKKTSFAGLWQICQKVTDFFGSLQKSPDTIILAEQNMSSCLAAAITPYLAEAIAYVTVSPEMQLQYYEFEKSAISALAKASSWITFPITPFLDGDGIFEDMGQNGTADLRGDPAYTRLEFFVQQYGYGYGLNGTTTYIAMAVLLLHSALALYHMTSTIFHGRINKSWTGLTDITVLAWNSAPTEKLSGSSLGVKDKKLWSEMVYVKDTADGRKELTMNAEESPRDESASS